MALYHADVTFDVHQILGADFDARRTKAYVRTNVENKTLMDTSTGEIRMGDQAVTINSDGTGTFTTWVPGVDGNPVSWQTYIVFDYARTGQRDRQTRTFGPYTITGIRYVERKSLTSNVATITTTTPHGLVVGDVVTVAGVDATFDGTYTITAVPSTTRFSYAKTAADVTTVLATGEAFSTSVPLTWLEEEQAVPPAYLTTVTELLDGIVADASDDADRAEAAQAATEANINGLDIGTVTTGAAGSPAAVTLTGTAPGRHFNFTIPTGPQGLPGPGAAAWAATAAVTAGAIRQAPDGSWIKSNAARTTRSSFDATEETFWTSVSADPTTVDGKALTASIDGAVSDTANDSYAKAKFARGLHIHPGKNGVNGADGADDLAAIQAILNSVSPTLGVMDVVIHSGTYRVNGVNTSVTGGTKNQWQGGGLRPKAGTRLILAPDAILKVATTSSPGYSCISLDATQSGVTIRGGQILGDRATHDYVTEPTYTTHEWGYGISMIGARDIVIEGVSISGCTGDGIYVYASGNYSSPGTGGTYVPSERITIRGNVIDGNRRNNISVVGVDGCTIENNKIKRAGYNDGIHDGVSPKFGIDLEANGTGTTSAPVFTQLVQNVTIRGNTFEGNIAGAVMNYNGFGVNVEGNFSDNVLAMGYGSDFTVRGNVVKNVTNTTDMGINTNLLTGAREARGVIADNIVYGFDVGIEVGRDNVIVSGNLVQGYNSKGISLRSTQVAVVDNQIINAVANQASAVSLTGATFCRISNNRISGVYRAIRFQTASSNIQIANNSITTVFRAVDVSGNGTTVTIADNVIAAAGWSEGQSSDIAVSGASTVFIRGNIIRDTISSSTSISVTSFTGTIEVVRNQFLGFLALQAVSVAGSTGGIARIIGNTFASSRTSGSPSAVALSGTIDKVLVLDNAAYNVNTTKLTSLVTIAATTVTNTRVVGNTVGTSTGTGSLVSGTDGGTLVETGNNLYAA